MRPPPGSMVFWRFKEAHPRPWRFGYCTYTNSPDIIRLGNWNGDTMGGSLVSAHEVEWKEY